MNGSFYDVFNVLDREVFLKKYSHVLKCYDKVDHSAFMLYIQTDDDLEAVINRINNGITSVEQIYDVRNNLNVDVTFPYNMNSLHFKKSNVQRALDYATEKHKGQYRKDGSEYINHPIRVAQYVARFKKSHNLDTLIMCAYLHDVIEDTDATYYDLVREFGVQVASIVMELTTDEDFKRELGKTKYLEYKMKNMTDWALVIKLCDRLDNVSDLVIASDKFRAKYVLETVEILKFLIENRDLSPTQIEIMKEIGRVLHVVCNCYQDDVVMHSFLNPIDEINLILC